MKEKKMAIHVSPSFQEKRMRWKRKRSFKRKERVPGENEEFQE